MAQIHLKNIRKSFGVVDVIKGVDLEIEKGEFMVFVGPSGCGKSTLLRLIAGLEHISGGELTFDGQLMNNLVPSERGIAMVFQSYALYPHMNVFDNMAFGLKQAGESKAQIKERVEKAAELLQIDHLLDRLPKQMSGGQRQRVAIGRAIVRNPKVFLFDEPLSNLDAALRVATRLEIAKLHHDMSDATMIYVTHDQLEARTLADRICVLRDGQIEQVGTPIELYENPNSVFVAGFIGSPKMNFLTGPLAEAQDCTTLDARAEHIEIVTPTNALWSGPIVHAEDLGSDHFVFVDLGTNDPVIVRHPGTFKSKLGEIVHLRPTKMYRFGSDDRPLDGMELS